MGRGDVGLDSLRRMLPPLHAVVLTQFLSAFADNLNFFLIVGMVKRQGVANPDIMVDYIQIGFLGAYIILAPLSARLPIRMPNPAYCCSVTFSRQSGLRFCYLAYQQRYVIFS